MFFDQSSAQDEVKAVSGSDFLWMIAKRFVDLARSKHVVKDDAKLAGHGDTRSSLGPFSALGNDPFAESPQVTVGPMRTQDPRGGRDQE